MSKKYLAKILARDLNGLNLISLYCHKSILKVSDIKFLKKNKIFLLSLQRNSIKAKNKNMSDANEWIPTEAVKKIKELQATFDGKMSETCISQILYEFNIIWRNIMRKENDAIKTKMTL